MEPQSGKILGMASYPNYEPQKFFEYESGTYKNPSLANAYEPGSTFKVLTVAAGIDAGVIEPDTKCPNCDGPREIGKYTIRTWNNEYHPDINMSEALAKSDNIAMIFVAEKLGNEKLIDYLKKFGIGQITGVELQEDSSPNFPEKWGNVELATRSFGQGISVTGLQLVRAIASIANGGELVTPQIIEKVIDKKTGQEITVQPTLKNQIISKQSAQQVTQMMIYAAKYGEAQWTATRNYTVAGKTGTSQVPDESGGYKKEATIASFIGFTPAQNPKYIMLVKLNEPQSSPWAAETAAPLWYQIADQLELLL